MQSFISIPTGNNRLFGLQIGPDNKIYCSSLYSNYLSVINKPDSIGSASDFVRFGINLNGNLCISGLPNMIIAARKLKVVLIKSDTTLCTSKSLILGEETVSGNFYLWQDGSTKSTYKVTKPGKYTLRVKNW